MKTIIKILIICLFACVFINNANSYDSLGFNIRIYNDIGEEFNNTIFGVHKDATYGVDEALGENYDLPWPPPDQITQAAFAIEDTAKQETTWSYKDLRPIFNQKKFQHQYYFSTRRGFGKTLTIKWDKMPDNYIDSAFIIDNITGKLVVINMKDSTSATITNEYFRNFYIKVYYNKDDVSVNDSKRENQDYIINPNPAKDIINIQTNELGYSYKIYNLNSCEVMSSPAEVTNNYIDISKFAVGMYYIQFQSKDGKFYFEKFIKYE